jgi:phenylalanyl-tRNA synthetase beta chain
LPENINFVPLTENEGRLFRGKELLDFYRQDPSAKHLKPYTDIIYDSPVYPVITDSNGTVLSMPPIINSKHSRIQLDTRNVFIECTGTDITKVNIVLDTVVTMFSEYCSVPFTVEPVTIRYSHNETSMETPLLSHRTCDASMDEINGIIGISITPEKACELSNRMQLGPAEYLPNNRSIRVQVPPTRSDILHAVDVVEDIAIAYGFNNILREMPRTQTVGAALPINHFSDLLRIELANAGYMEMLTHGLCSTAENFTHLRRPITAAVSLSNPVNKEYEVVRTTLIPGALKTLAHNRSISHKDGVKLFEISDVVIRDSSVEVGAKNVRRLVALYAANIASFEIIHGLVDRVMICSQIQPEEKYAANSLTSQEIADLKRIARSGRIYTIEYCDDPIFFSGMGAKVLIHYTQGDIEPLTIGVFGVVHPEVLKSYDISYPCAIAEIDVETLMKD